MGQSHLYSLLFGYSVLANRVSEGITDSRLSSKREEYIKRNKRHNVAYHSFQ